MLRSFVCVFFQKSSCENTFVHFFSKLCSLSTTVLKKKNSHMRIDKKLDRKMSHLLYLDFLMYFRFFLSTYLKTKCFFQRTSKYPSIFPNTNINRTSPPLHHLIVTFTSCKIQFFSNPRSRNK